MPRRPRPPAFLPAAALATCLAFAPAASAADDPLPPVDPPARAAVAEDPHVACSLIGKAFDPAKQTLTVTLRLRNKTAKPVTRLTGQFTWRSADGTDLAYILQDPRFDPPIPPGQSKTIERTDTTPQNATPEQRAEWLKNTEGLTEVRLAVLRIWYADGTVETVRFPKRE